jgi:hypothetical protein
MRVEDALRHRVRFWWGKWFSISYSAVYKQFKDLLPVLDCLAVGAPMCCRHDDTIGPFRQCHQIRLIFF